MRTPQVLVREAALRWFPRWFNKYQCSKKGGWNQYFKEAEGAMESQWEEYIWPLVQELDLSVVLELAPGAGRNTEKLADYANVIHAVDLNDDVIDQLRKRFDAYDGACKFHFYKNNGTNLEMIPDKEITTIYCWDSAVHFEKSIMRDYIKEFHRVLRPGGFGFIHHSNLGETASLDLTKNPGLRSNMSKNLFARYCQESGLEVVSQTLIPWGDFQDCISVFSRTRD